MPNMLNGRSWLHAVNVCDFEINIYLNIYTAYKWQPVGLVLLPMIDL